MSNKKNANNKVNNAGAKMPVGNMRTTKTDYDIPTFGFKSAILIIIAAFISTVILPVVLQFINLPVNLVAVIANTFITSYAVAYSRYFIESKKGYCKGFWITYIIFAVSCFVIGFFWLYLNSYI